MRIILVLTLSLFTAYGLAPLGGLVSSAHASCGDTPGPSVNWEGCRKSSLVISGTDFTGSTLVNTDMSSSDLRDSTFNKSNLEKANLVRASLAGSTAVDASFESIVSSRTSFKDTTFTNTTFNKAELIRADFSGATISGANMSRAELSRANFDGATLENIDFSFSSMGRIDLRGATLAGTIAMEGSYLFQARIEGVDLSMVTGLADWQLPMACGDADTKLPDGVARPGNWPCEDG